MLYLIVQTAGFLVLAALLGFGVGWLFRHSRARLGIQQSQASWEVRFAQLQSERDEAIESSKRDRARTETIEDDLNKYRLKLENQDEELSPMRKTLDELREKRLEWERDRKQSEHSADALRAELEAAQEERDRARAELGEIQQALQARSRSLTFHKGVSQTSQAIRRELFQELHKARKDIDEARKDVEERSAEAKALKAELDSARERLKSKGMPAPKDSGPLARSAGRSATPLSDTADAHALRTALKRARGRVAELETELCDPDALRRRLETMSEVSSPRIVISSPSIESR